MANYLKFPGGRDGTETAMLNSRPSLAMGVWENVLLVNCHDWRSPFHGWPLTQ
ncbi:MULTISPECIES: hypothetical protein [unclassified Synechocystis]|uniref:hypothetical protein n=1 Tax=unclassified Synechocystis TaxID=2640012 RepID=UPI000AFDA7AB|nr:MULTISPECIES: hypothetical protein [unclassified Synechocystis]MBD2618271.1 hypothetical protein [Synechocystis sp. FACHB-898]MBD2637738.1 hypothetical protein [Synechocystis sp. FACHB-908]MBD2661317.1 hypothetical protein [Synechocystis sp. FACHB-929]NHL97385.1 hypothetical protein [Synechocystis sp. PCC 6803]QWO80973.1 hypothetical protein KBZ93_02225 [Synechocystis sp. PCC 6803]